MRLMRLSLLTLAISILGGALLVMPASAATAKEPDEADCRIYVAEVAKGTDRQNIPVPDYAKSNWATFIYNCYRKFPNLFPNSPSPTPPNTGSDCDKPFITFSPWHKGLRRSPHPACNILPDNFSTEAGFQRSVWIIILNIVSMLFGLIGYLALGFVIYGGYLYVLARGDPSRIAKGKQTVIRALTGLVICILASLISGAIVGIIAGAVGA